VKRRGTAHWERGLKDGRGVLSTESGVLDGVRYSFATRFGEERGTNPEELIAAAHAGCFSMALAFLLERAGTPAERIDTSAEISLGFDGQRATIDGIRLRVEARIPGMDHDAFQQVAGEAKSGCLVSRLITATPIALEAILVT
jgi:lipoyl-dependent peroxiredoxin